MIAKEVSMARAKEDKDYREAIETAVNFFYGRQADRVYYDPHGRMKPDTWQRLENFLGGLNITAMIAHKIGGAIYDRAPMRELDIPDKELLGRVSALWEEDDTYVEMDQIAALNALLGQIFIAPVWDADDQVARLTVYTPDQVRVFQDRIFPNKAEAFALTWSDSQTYGQVNTYTKIMDREQWRVVAGDLQTMNLMDYKAAKKIEAVRHPDSGKLWQDVNPLAPEVPIVHLKYMAEIGAGTIHGVGLFNEVVSMNMIVNMMLTTLRVLVKDQSLATLVIKNVEDTSNLRIGLANTVLALRDTMVGKTGESVPADARYITPPSNIDKLISAVQVDLGAMFNRFGLRNKNPLRLDVSSPESGIAKWIEDAEVRRQQTKQIPRLLRAEKDMLHYWMAADYNGRGKPIPPWLKDYKYDYTVNFVEPEKYLTMQERQVRDEWHRTLGLRDEIDMLMEEDHDIKTVDEAIEHIVERKRRAQELQRQIAALSPMPEADEGRFNLL